MQAVTFAVVHTIGSSWRLVTLDDAAIAPVGVETVPRAVFRAGGGLFDLAVAVGRGAIATMQWGIGGMCLVIGVQMALAHDWRRALVDGTLEPYVRIYASVMEHRVPVHYIGPTLPGIFAVLMTAVAASFVVLLVGFLALLVSVPFFGFVVMASSSAQALREAEAAKTRPVKGVRDVADAVQAVSARGRQTFAPRLMVLRVDGSVWQQTVSALAGVTAASVIDVSDPTEHLLWEMDQLERLCPGRWIIIGEHARLTRWVGEDAQSAPRGAVDARFGQWLEGRDVLAYTTDRRGMRRFARALYGRLLELERPPRVGGSSAPAG
jgi:hypothetical protein